jgi:hypothetical protein
MAKKSKKENHYDFIGLPIDDLITKPLISIVRAQEEMAKEQIKDLLKSCFYFDGEYYKPIMLKMSLTRAVIESGEKINDQPKIEHIITYFNLPLITLFPLNSLGISTVNIDFDMEVTSQYSLDINIDDDEENESDKITSQAPWFKRPSNIEILGKIAPQKATYNNFNTGINQSESRSQNASYSIDVTASPLPLTKGLLAIIEAYTKAIEPIEMPKHS